MEGSNQEALEVSMGKELYDILPLYPMCSICRVPEKLRRLNENAYTPRVVSIGPFHHGKESLKPMEEQEKIPTELLAKEPNKFGGMYQQGKEP